MTPAEQSLGLSQCEFLSWAPSSVRVWPHGEQRTLEPAVHCLLDFGLTQSQIALVVG